jgi:hypothetical protein
MRRVTRLGTTNTIELQDHRIGHSSNAATTVTNIHDGWSLMVAQGRKVCGDWVRSELGKKAVEDRACCRYPYPEYGSRHHQFFSFGHPIAKNSQN